MQALVLERKDELNLRDFAVEEELGPRYVRIALRTVGVCGSDALLHARGDWPVRGQGADDPRS